MHISASAAGDARADRVGVELHELAEAAGAGLFVAEDIAGAVAAIGLRQRVEILGDIARQRRGQIVAQRDPLLVVVLEREHALVRPVLVGQELAERVGEFHRRRFHRLEAVALVDGADFVDHRARRGDLGGPAIVQPARQARFEFLGFFGFFGHGAALVPADAGCGKRLVPVILPENRKAWRDPADPRRFHRYAACREGVAMPGRTAGHDASSAGICARRSPPPLRIPC